MVPHKLVEEPYVATANEVDHFVPVTARLDDAEAPPVNSILASLINLEVLLLLAFLYKLTDKPVIVALVGILKPKFEVFK